MKKTKTKRSTKPEPDMLPEYDFDYSKARPNRFAKRFKESSEAVLVVVEPDVAAYFQTSKSVNAVLRALIATMPREKSR